MVIFPPNTKLKKNITTLVDPEDLMAALFYEAPLELDSVETSTSHSPLHVLLEGSSVIIVGKIQLNC